MPIRNKSKDNPYILGYDEDKKSYTVEFKDNRQVIHKVEITEKVYQAFDSFELEDISQIHKYRFHIEHSEIYEETLNKRMIEKPITIEEEVEKKIIFEDIREVINSLPEVQKKTIKKVLSDAYGNIEDKNNKLKGITFIDGKYKGYLITYPSNYEITILNGNKNYVISLINTNLSKQEVYDLLNTINIEK